LKRVYSTQLGHCFTNSNAAASLLDSEPKGACLLWTSLWAKQTNLIKWKDNSESRLHENLHSVNQQVLYTKGEW